MINHEARGKTFKFSIHANDLQHTFRQHVNFIMYSDGLSLNFRLIEILNYYFQIVVWKRIGKL